MFNDAETGLMMRMPCKKLLDNIKICPSLKMRPKHLGSVITIVVFLLRCLGKLLSPELLAGVCQLVSKGTDS